MSNTITPNQSVKEYIRIQLKPVDGKDEMEHFEFSRRDGYQTNIDAGYEDLLLREDSTKIMMYMQNDNILFNNSRRYRVVKREFQPCIPVMLYLYVEEIE